MIVTKWININEELPIDNQECLIVSKTKKIVKATWISGERFNKPAKEGDWYYNQHYYKGITYWIPLPSAPHLIYNKYYFEDDFFGAVINCAIRYCLGRQSYTPSLVIDEVRKVLPLLNDKTIGCMERDIREADKFSGYGDEKIDKPEWLKFLKEIQDLMDKRGIERWR